MSTSSSILLEETDHGWVATHRERDSFSVEFSSRATHGTTRSRPVPNSRGTQSEAPSGM